MVKKLLISTVLLIILNGRMNSQDTGYGPTYQTILMSNPGFSGASGDGTLRLSYLNFYPGRNYNFHSFYASYDSYFSELHGGAGVWIADDYLGGIVNDLRGGISYAYSLRAGKEIYINAGLGTAFFRRGFSFGDAILPDMIDGLGGITFPTAEVLADQGKSVLDISTGFLLMYRKFFAGLSFNHLSQPGLSREIPGEKLKRKLMAEASWLAGGENLRIRPFGFFELQGGLVTGSAGASAETKHLSFSVMLSQNNAGNMNLQTGFAVNTGRLGLFYNYRFSVMSASSLMPVSMMHQTGISFGLNHVDKRDIPAAITMPLL
ncbi:MAG TPA: type IX secretion system membrane protein PorP/SprF [Bacteroidales bacterium]|nr:type IX secretion system membrane protein PorP/SprF [Bacteroidales bacterium]